MRTKTLLLTVAVSAASLATSMAQVYSVNSVGYINLTMTAGLNPVANQLNAGNNSINAVLPSVPNLANVITLVGSSYVFDTFINDGSLPTGWYDADGNPSPTTLEPGKGWYYNDPNQTTPYAITLVGEVPEGGSLTVPIPSGLRFSAGIVPQQLALRAVNGFPEVNGMQYIRFNKATVAYDVYIFVNDGSVPTGWYDQDGNPSDAIVIADVGLGFFTSNSGGPVNWVRCFRVSSPCP